MTRACWLVCGVSFVAVTLAIGPAWASGTEIGPLRLRDVPDLKRDQAEALREGASEYREWRRASRHVAGRRPAVKPRGGLRPRMVDERTREALGAPSGTQAEAGTARLQAIAATPPNVRVNNPTGETGITQAEQHVGFYGSLALSTWNDGASPNFQGWGTSTDGGATWTDGGALPPLPGGGNWYGDPVVAVDEKSGTFYVSGLDLTPTLSGIAVARGRFTAGTFNWENISVVRTVSQTTDFLDKEWIAADSTNGNLYLSYTHFTVTGDSIVFQRSTDAGVTWGPMLTLNSPSTNGLVQGSRPAVGPNGEVYVEWYEIGPVDADFWRVAKSTNAGVSFGAPVQAGSGYSNYGTGAPGFNRLTGVDFAGIAVDRSKASTRGRVYVTWPEAVDFYNDNLGTLPAKAEVEPNNAGANATAFTPGALLHGRFSSTSDQDWFSFSGTAGKTYIFFCDSIPNCLYAMLIRCSDQTTSLAASGDNTPDDGPGGRGLIVWTAPKSGTYYLRMSFLNVSPSAIGGYRVWTGVHVASVNDRARDARDIAVASSANGVSFGAPVRPTDDAAGYDDWLPELAVATDGMVYAAWYDWRDSPSDCSGSSNTYITRSTDGGATWAANVRITDMSTAWSFVTSNLAPNQGDYLGTYGGDTFDVVWADGRSGDPDVYSVALDPRYSVSCGRDTVGNRGDVLSIPFYLFNHNSQFGNDYQMTVSDDRGWFAGTPPSPVAATAGQNVFAPVTVTVPDTALGGVNHVRVLWNMADGALPETCTVALTINAPTGVGPGPQLAFGLRGVEPNPAIGRVTIRFSLPVAAPANLEVLDLAGRRVAEREVGAMGPGAHTVTLSSELASLPAGVYAVRLRQLGNSQTVKLSLMR
jgi:hypothetical protein